MGIERGDIDSGRVDVSDLATGRRLPPVHPGEILRGEFLQPMGLSVTALAKALKLPRSRLNAIARARRPVTADTALRLGRYFGTSAAMWMNLQSAHDLDVADRSLRQQIEREVAPRVG